MPEVGWTKNLYQKSETNMPSPQYDRAKPADHNHPSEQRPLTGLADGGCAASACAARGVASLLSLP
jgi:hypothetical protein